MRVRSCLEGPDTEIREAPSGPEAICVFRDEEPDLAILDMQVGSMGGIAICMEMRLVESYGDLPHIPVLLLLDRRADVFLAKRSGAEGWVVKPLDPARLAAAAGALLIGQPYRDPSLMPHPIVNPVTLRPALEAG